MFNTIFSKLVSVFIAILILSFSIAGALLYYFLGYSVSEKKVETLLQSGNKIASFFEQYIKYQDNPLADLYLNMALESSSQNTNSIIWIIDKHGNIFKASQMPDIIADNLKYSAGKFSLPDERQYKEIVSGEVSYIKKTGDFYGLFKGTGEAYLTIQMPFIYQINNKKEVVGAICLFARMPGIYEARSSTFKIFIIAVAFSILISIILIYVFSRRLVKPLNEIKNAAKEISGGQFHKRLNIDSEDEIGDLAKSFNNMIIALQNLENMRRDFIANVSHELRTPMTSIRGFVEGIIDGTIPPEKHKGYLIIVRDEVNRLNRLVNDLLDLARMEAGEMKLSFRNFNINELIRRCIIKLESIITEKDIQIEANFEEEDMIVNADSDAIERVIINLIHNAVKFTPNMGKIILSTSWCKDKVMVSVVDNGIGIEKDDIGFIWDRFYKSDKSRGKDKTGTGLGLAIIKNIINEHKQEIHVESELGEGTKFYFTLDKEKNIEA